jgi:two-component system nitrogen regulation response regulator GlnG
MNKELPEVEMRVSVASMEASLTPAVKVLIVDDQEDARWILTNVMRQAGFVPIPAASGEDALISIQRHAPAVVLLDIGLPDMDGFEVLTRIKALDKSIPVIMVTGNGKPYDAARAVRAGAWDYITKPFKNKDVLNTVRGALAEKAEKSQVRRIVDTQRQADSLLHSMGTSASIKGIQREVELVARTTFSILVTGESGSGKELVSQAIHALSLRAEKPLVAVDCGAIAESLIESELFGHEKGSFTGAHQAKVGAFELADGGTIFLDEIGNLPLAMQGKLLRVLETRRVHRIGSTREKKVDFRVVAATNANLMAMVERREFREDLYHRLAEYSIRIPPLRERKEDLAFLTQRFLAQTNAELGKQVKGLSTTALGIVQRYDWHGNARELRNHLRRAVLLCDHPEGLIPPELLGMLDERAQSVAPPVAALKPAVARRQNDEAQPCPLCNASVLPDDGPELSLKELVGRATAQLERAILLRVLAKSKGNKAQAARILQIDYKTMHTKLKVYEISATQFMKDAYKPEG